MKDKGQLEESIERFRRGFWNRETLDRPPVGVAADRTWLPINYLKAPLPRQELQPEDVGPEIARTDYEDSFAARPVESDDLLPYAAAWRAIPWLEAMCGCPVRAAAGSLVPGRSAARIEDLTETPIPSRREWIETLRRETVRLRDSAPEDCWVSPTILRGTSDVLAAMRGLDDFYLDLHDDPQAIARAAARVNKLHLEVLELHFSLVKPKLGGYGHIYGYWAPGPTTVLQEDALGMCSPSVYRNLFMQLNAEIVERLGPYVLFHLHSTGYRHFREVLAVPGIAGLEITVEANGPRLSDMLPALREIVDRSRLILCVDAYMDELPSVLRRLPKEGLYLMVSDKFVRDEEEFQRLLALSGDRSGRIARGR
jgi:hypothetical protein